jgi:hypothetical protein
METIIAGLNKEQITEAFNKAVASRGRNKGRLKSKCPKMNTMEAVVWQAVMSHANPFKASMWSFFWFNENQKEFFNHIDKIITDKKINVMTMDKDRMALEMMGVW